MKQIGSLLWEHVAPFQVFGANTGVGKTVASVALLRSRAFRETHQVYIKPVSTGSLADADLEHIRKFVPRAYSKTLLWFDVPVSPHLAAQGSRTAHDDQTLLELLQDQLVNAAGRSYNAIPRTRLSFPLVECAGGVLSPGPSGTPQADLYRPLRLPAVLVGDHKLGGIATTISAYESLYLRGYDVVGMVMFKDTIYENSRYLRDYFSDRGVLCGFLEMPPDVSADKSLDQFTMKRYYDLEERRFITFPTKLVQALRTRKEKLKSLPDRAVSAIWHPFMQHTERSRDSILAIDSAYGDNFSAVTKAPGPGDSILAPAFDGSASWWTQGLGHGNPGLALEAAHAAGRYGHVMFASAAHEPAVYLAEMLTIAAGKASKVFYTDNGSTGMEVAVKMALKASAKRYGWQPSDDIMVLGLKGSYHGDTIGVMDCSEGNVYNAKVEWYRGRGYWFDFPKVIMSRGKWHVVPPQGSEDIFNGTQTFDSLNEVFDLEKRTHTGKLYAGLIDKILQHLVGQGNKFGALIMEPVILGAGGMLLADPLFQHELWQATQRLDQGTVVSPDVDMGNQKKGWKGMPLICDEVFTGLYRLGKIRSSNMIKVEPDVTVFAKLLTGGLLPLATTVASQSIFNAFLSDDKADALLHGHSYTAHAMGCSVAIKSLETYSVLDRSSSNEKAATWTPFKQDWEALPSSGLDQPWKRDQGLWSFWPSSFVTKLSHRDDVEGVFALGCVLAIEIKDPQGAGYTSTASIGIRDRLSKLQPELNQSVHCRVLGNVLYFMSSLTSTSETLAGVQSQIEAALDGP